MYDINTKFISIRRRDFYLFLFAGLLFMFIFFYVLSRQDYYKKATLIGSTSTSDNNLIYTYEVNGNRYECTNIYWAGEYDKAPDGIIYYNVRNKSECELRSNPNTDLYILLIFFIIPFSTLSYSLINIHNVNKRVREIKKLNKTGTLIKKIPYFLKNTGIIINNVPIKCPVIYYTLKSGYELELRGDPRFDKKVSNDGFVDLLIDETNPAHYFMDYEINRLTDNLDTDYYNESNDKTNV